jgi:hypothetical protein
LEALVAADMIAEMIKAPFVVGARVNRTLVLFTTEHNIKRAGFQSVKSGNKRRFSAASGNEADSWASARWRLAHRWCGLNPPSS